MSVQTVTIQLPEMLYRSVARRAKRLAASVEDEIVAVVASGLAREDELPSATIDALAQLELLTDDELQSAATSVVSAIDDERIQILLQKQGIDGLSASEQEEAEHLLQRADRVMLLRAKAAILQLNRLPLVESRQMWISAGWHPPVNQ